MWISYVIWLVNSAMNIWLEYEIYIRVKWFHSCTCDVTMITQRYTIIEFICNLDITIVTYSIRIFEMKWSYYMMIITYWFLQTLSVISRELWDDDTRHSYHDSMGTIKMSSDILVIIELLHIMGLIRVSSNKWHLFSWSTWVVNPWLDVSLNY